MLKYFRVIGLLVVLAACVVVLNAQTVRISTTARPAGATVTPASAVNGSGAHASVTTSTFNSFWNGAGAGIGLGNIFAINTAPTATTFCTSPSVPSNNGTIAFTINVGTACATSVGTITLPTATTGWVADCHNVTVPASNIVEQTGGTTTTVTVTNYARTTGVASNWTDSAVLRCRATAY